MAKIVNLGRFGQPRPSPLSGLPEAIAAGKERKLERERLEGLNKYREALIKGKAEDRELRKKRYEAKLAEFKSDEARRNIKLASDTWKRVSLMLRNKNEAEQEQLLNTPAFQDLGKDLIKPYLPEAWDEEKGVIRLQPMEEIPDTLEEAQEMKVKSARAIARMKRGLPPRVEGIPSLIQSTKMSNSLNFISDSQADEMMRFLSDLQYKLLNNLKVNMGNNPFRQKGAEQTEGVEPLRQEESGKRPLSSFLGGALK